MIRVRCAGYCMFVWLGLLCIAGSAHASDIRTYPTRLTLTPTEAIGAINVKNNSPTKTVIQMEAVAWSQTSAAQDSGNLEDKYDPTRELLINPMIFELAPGAEQVVRVGLQASQGGAERTYRVFLQEIPPRDTPLQSGITTLLRIGIPVFVPPKDAVSNVTWAITPGAGGMLNVVAVNKGNVHIQFTGFDMQVAGNEIFKESVFAYLLPGQTRKWVLKTKGAVRPGDTVHVEAATDQKQIVTDIVVGPSEGGSQP